MAKSLAFLDTPAQFQPVHLRHHDIADHDIRVDLFELFQRLFAIGGFGYGILVVELLFQILKDLEVVID